jgi:cohesin loading factor subunit SCC2
VGMSDDIVIQTVYVAVSPFFVSSAPSSGTAKGKAAEKKVSEAATAVVGGKSELRGLRLDALGLVRAVSTAIA